MNDKDSLPFTFHCPRWLHEAMTTAARTDYCSRSDVARQALIRSLQERGILKQAEEAAA
jgi:hypothetical protein